MANSPIITLAGPAMGHTRQESKVQVSARLDWRRTFLRVPLLKRARWGRGATSRRSMTTHPTARGESAEALGGRWGIECPVTSVSARALGLSMFMRGDGVVNG
jgi:hypothetical protein